MKKGIFRSSFFRLPEHRKFNYKPLYFDAEKEEREQRAGKKPIKMERGAFYKNKNNKSRLVGAFTEDGYDFKEYRKGKVDQAVRFILLVMMLSLIAFIMIGEGNNYVSLTLLLFLLVIFVQRVNRR